MYGQENNVPDKGWKQGGEEPMEERIKVSVVMPVYNAAEYLEQCLDSVVGQTLREIEILCVDDGSTDASGSILEAYRERDGRLQIFHQENRYAGCARNLGLAHAVGKYVVFWDADDFFELDALEKLYKKCEEDQAELCVCSAKRMDNETGLTYKSGVYLAKKMLPQERPFSKREIPQYIFNFTTNVPWNKMYLREFVQRHGVEFQALRQANDAYFSMVVLFLAERITVIEEPLMTYRMDNTVSLTGKASDNRFCVMEAYRAVGQKLRQYPEFSGPVYQSFTNKMLEVLLFSLRTQWNVQAYEELYDLYKGELLEEFGIAGKPAEYFYNQQSYRDLCQMMERDAHSFLLYSFRSYERRFKNANGSLSNAKAELKELKKENNRLKKIETSNSYKAGRALTYLPRKVRQAFKKTGK